MKIAVCSLAIGKEYKNTVKYCTKTLSNYCLKHSYDLFTNETRILTDREYMWNKIPLLRDILPDYDYVVWIDGDMMILNDEIKLETFIELYLGCKETMLSVDSGNQINTGFWVLKNTEYIKSLLEMIENLPELAGNFHEQGVFNTLYHRNVHNLQERSRIIPENESRIFNATLYTYEPNDFLIHFLGIRNLNNLSKVIEDHYPNIKEHECIDKYNLRMKWFEKRYNNRKNDRYIIPSSKVKITVRTFFTGNKYSPCVIEYGQKSLKKYCQKYNYQLKTTGENIQLSLPPHWMKLALLFHDIKNGDYDYIVWIDADVMIMNHDITLESIIEKNMNGKDFLLSRDISNEINTGIIFVRKTNYSQNLLELILNLPELRYRGCEDQDAFNQVYNRNLLKFQNHCSILPEEQQSEFNLCVGKYKWGMWAIHFFSLSREGLQKAFNDFYPFKKDGESTEMYQHRLQWIQNK